MTTPRSIIVGISGAPADETAVAWALAECQHDGSQLVLAHACSSRPGEERGEPDALLRHPGVASAIARGRRELGDDRVTVTIGEPPSGVLLVRLAGPDDLLVVGPPSHRDFMHWSSTTHHVARHAAGPVVVAPPSRPAHADAVFAGHVVVGVDGSPAARAALAFGYAYAAAHGVPLAAVHVAPTAVRDIWYDDMWLETHLTEEPRSLELLARELETSEHAYPSVWTKRAAYSGQPVDGLLRAAEGADLLVLGTHGGGAGRRVRLGATSLDAISRATCPIALLKPPAVAIDSPHRSKEVHHVPA